MKTEDYKREMELNRTGLFFMLSLGMEQYRWYPVQNEEEMARGISIAAAMMLFREAVKDRKILTCGNPATWETLMDYTFVPATSVQSLRVGGWKGVWGNGG